MPAIGTVRPWPEETEMLDVILLICKIGGIAAALTIGGILLGIALGKINV
jgi:hypothetical protein